MSREEHLTEMVRLGQEILQENEGHEWAGFDAGWTDCTCGKTVADLKEHIELIKGEQPHPPQQFRDRSNGE